MRKVGIVTLLYYVCVCACVVCSALITTMVLRDRPQESNVNLSASDTCRFSYSLAIHHGQGVRAIHTA